MSTPFWPFRTPDPRRGGANFRQQFWAACFKTAAVGHTKDMIILGLILLLLGLVTGIGILWTIGVVLIVVGLILMLLGRSGRQVGGRAHYW